jgi:hypothetical protein
MTDIQQDLHDARALLEQGGREDEKKKYRKAAEIILLKALRLDPENQEAKMLMQSVRSVPVSRAPAASLALTEPPSPASYPVTQPMLDDAVPFAGPALFESLGKEKKKKTRPRLLFGLILTLVLGGGLIWIGQTHGMSPIGRSLSHPPAPRQQVVQQMNDALSRPASASSEPQSVALPLPAGPPVLAVRPTQAAAPPVPAPAAAPAAEPAPAPAAVTPATATFGKLAVNSTTAADIYQGDKFLGKTPATLKLPAGRQTLEYRHGELRTVISHDIKAAETTNASVTFQTTVQINAKPWANVFLDGAQRRALGQTPLSSVSIPVGSTLVFENPNFVARSHRVTENDTAIQVDFQ